MAIEYVEVLDTRVHELEAVRRAGYALADVCAMRVKLTDEHHLEVRCQSSAGADLPEDFPARFAKTLLDFGIRLSLARETGQIRDLVYRQAFVEADL